MSFYFDFKRATYDAEIDQGLLGRVPELSARLMKKCSNYLKKAKHGSMIETLDVFIGNALPVISIYCMVLLGSMGYNRGGLTFC